LSRLATLIPRFAAADKRTRLETLLDYSKKLPPLAPELAELAHDERYRVTECQTPVYLFIAVPEGRVKIQADVPPESPTVRGFLSLLIRTLNDEPAAAVAAVPDDLLDRLGLTEALGMNRTQGLTAILQRVKRGVATAARAGG
jgi:cysteine desulfuration protein SufE